MNIITSLLLLLGCSRFFGRIFQSFGHSPVIGEILAGLLLSPTVFNAVAPSKELSGIVELGIFLMIFAAGLEMDLQDIFSAIRKKAILCSLTGFLFSFATGLGIGKLWSLPLFSSLILSLCFAITALPIVIRFMNNFKLKESPMGHVIMGSAVIIDVLALLFFGVILNVEDVQNNSFQFIKMVLFKMGGMAVFFVIVMMLNQFLRSEVFKVKESQSLIKKWVKKLGEDAVFGIGMIFVLLFSTATEALGFHFIIGAFFGGLLLNKDIIGTSAFDSMTHILHSITNQFLTPIFFASIGLYFSVEAFSQPALLVSIVAAAFLSKMIGGGLGAAWSGFNKKESCQMGIALNCRGTLDVIVAEIALSKGYVDSRIFSILVCISIASLLLNPVLYKQTAKKDAQGQT